MAYIIKDSKKEYTPAPQGLHQAVCIDVVELGLVTTQYKGEPYTRRCSEVRWVIEDMDPKTGKQIMVTKRYTESLHKKATLRLHLESWRGRKFTDEELKGFDIEKLIGANCQLQIAHNITSDGDVYANIQAVVSVHRNAARMAVPQDYVRVKDREEKKYPGESTGAVAESEEEYVPF
jgi:hypothetical protein